jgi:hypothetical protein
VDCIFNACNFVLFFFVISAATLLHIYTLPRYYHHNHSQVKSWLRASAFTDSILITVNQQFHLPSNFLNEMFHEELQKCESCEFKIHMLGRGHTSVVLTDIARHISASVIA